MFMNILMGAALLTVFGTLVMGVFQIGKPDKESQLKSNKLMRIRIAAQFVAICIFGLAYYLRTKTGG